MIIFHLLTSHPVFDAKYLSNERVARQEYARHNRKVPKRFERRMYRKYGGIMNVSRTIEYDLKHGVTKHEIMSFLVTLKTDDSFSQLRMASGFDDRMFQLEASLRSIEFQPRAPSFLNDYVY
ncbi:MAG TPA: hypothetical protein VF884_12115 [Nitrososphaeraceae archaeon]